MAAELGLLSITQLRAAQSNRNQHQNQLNLSISWMWNPNKPTQEDDDSWEVRAFEEDTGNVMGTTWPPRCYTCTFCRREFRSAQALGGHMNVHRRDRARLHQSPTGSIIPNSSSSSSASTSSSTFVIPTQELAANGGLCLLYQLPSPNAFITPAAFNACATNHSPSTLLSISPYPHSYPIASPVVNSSHFYRATAEAGGSIDSSTNTAFKDMGNEELDLELRLGQKSRSAPSSS